MKLILTWIISLLLLSCNTTPTVYPHSSLSGQILRVRQAYPNKLTNTSCLSYKNQACTNFDTITYDLKDDNVRNKLVDIGFICDIAGKRYRICREKPGYCRWEIACKHHYWYWMFACKEHEETYIPASNHQFLVDAKTECRKR